MENDSQSRDGLFLINSAIKTKLKEIPNFPCEKSEMSNRELQIASIVEELTGFLLWAEELTDKHMALNESKCKHSYWFRCKCGKAICNICGGHYDDKNSLMGNFEVIKEPDQRTPIVMNAPFEEVIGPAIVNIDAVQKEKDEERIEKEFYDGPLYDANPDCKHKFDRNCFSGVRCLKCSAWFCL